MSGSASVFFTPKGFPVRTARSNRVKRGATDHLGYWGGYLPQVSPPNAAKFHVSFIGTKPCFRQFEAAQRGGSPIQRRLFSPSCRRSRPTHAHIQPTSAALSSMPVSVRA